MQNMDWVYRVYDRNTPANLFGVFSPLVELWQSKGSTGDVPARRDFRFEDFEGWYGQISIAEIAPDLSKMVFLLWGTTIADWWGKDYTGKTMQEDSLPNHWEHVERPYVEAVLGHKGIGVCGGPLHVYQREFVHVTYVDLPLRHNGSLSRVLSVYARKNETENLQQVPVIHSYVEPY